MNEAGNPNDPVYPGRDINSEDQPFDSGGRGNVRAALERLARRAEANIEFRKQLNLLLMEDEERVREFDKAVISLLDRLMIQPDRVYLTTRGVLTVMTSRVGVTVSLLPLGENCDHADPREVGATKDPALKVKETKRDKDIPF